MDIFLALAAVSAVVLVGALVAAFAGWISRFAGGAAGLIAVLSLTTLLAIIYKQQVEGDKLGIDPVTLFGAAINVKLLMSLLIVLFVVAGWQMVADSRFAERIGGLSSTSLAMIPLAIAINIAVGQLVATVKLPLYLDSIGTVLVGALMGPWVALLTGALSNVIWTLSGLPNSGPAVNFAYVAAVIGVMAGSAGRAHLFQAQSPRWLSALVGAVFASALTLFVLMFLNPNPDPAGWPPYLSAGELFQQYTIVFVAAALLGAAAGYTIIQRAGYAGMAGLLTGIVAAILSAPMAAIVFGGVTGAGTDLLVAAFLQSGNSILESTLAQGVVSDPFDKMTSYLLVWMIVQSLPRRLLARFPNTRDVAPSQPIVEPAVRAM